MQPITLSSKFDSQILNKATEPEKRELKRKLDDIFSKTKGYILGVWNGFNSLTPERRYIVEHPELPGWVIKGPRSYGEVTPDTHIYRVRKALRINNIIKKYGFTEVVVPEKYLYQYKNEWVVVAKKLNLDPHAKIILTNFNPIYDTYNPLNPKAAKELAIICFEGRFDDLKENNLLYSIDGRIALVDTEPFNRISRKNISWWDKIWPSTKFIQDFTNGMLNTERLYKLCDTSQARMEVRKVQEEMLSKNVAQLVVYTVLPVLLSLGTLFTAMALAGPIVAGLAASVVVLTGYNTYRCIMDTLGIYASFQYFRPSYGNRLLDL